MATSKLFDLLLRLKNDDPRYKNQGVEALMTRRVDKIKQYILNKLPEACGVYYFFNKDKEIIYIGKSTNMYNRALAHFNTDRNKSKKMLNELYDVDFTETGSELIALLLESEEIKKHKPRYNRMRKNAEFTHCIDVFTDENDALNLKIVESEASENAVLEFTGYAAARERLEQWIEAGELCLAYCGLTSKESSCFNHQIKQCKGICCGLEDVEDYNRRVREILRAYQFPQKTFAILDAGRHNEERSVIVIEDYRYKGYGYLDSTSQISGAEELMANVRQAPYYPDSNAFVS